MKSFPFSTLRLFFAVLLLACCTSAFSQKTIVWKGGTPGLENDWNCPRNWNTCAVPDEFSNVMVPDVSTTTFTSPVIAKGRVAINSIFINSNASLTIGEAAQLVVWDRDGSYFRDNLHLKGLLFFPDESGKQAASAISSVDY